MKLWKKILIGVFVLAVVVAAFVGFGIYKSYQTYTQTIAPDMRRYVTMTQQEQDQYVLSKLGDLYGLVYRLDDSAKGQAARDALVNDPAIRQAGLIWGRAICATIILDDWNISNTLSPADRAKYAREADDLDDKGEHLKEEMERRILPRVMQ